MILYIAEDENSQPELLAKNVICYDYWDRDGVREIVSDYVFDHYGELPERTLDDLVDAVSEDLSNWEETFPDGDNICFKAEYYYSEVVNNEEDEESSDDDEEDEEED